MGYQGSFQQIGITFYKNNFELLVIFLIILSVKYSLEMQDIDSGALYDCKPWETGVLFDNTNLLSNFKQNLHCYEQGFRKFTIKSRCELPQISGCMKPKPVFSQCRLGEFERMAAINKSTEIPVRLPKQMKSKCMLAKLGKNDENMNKQNKEDACTDRIRSKEDYRTKIFLINFEDQIKYKRMKKRELHQVIFGHQNKARKCKQPFQ